MVALVAALTLTQTFAANGLALRTPPSWHRVDHQLTDCIDPAQRLAVAGPRGELVLIVERLRDPARRGAHHPRPFRLDTRPQLMECCAPRSARGWFFRWIEHRRELYAYAYMGAGTRRELARVLDSLRVAQRAT
jgi:hypothetical protein